VGVKKRPPVRNTGGLFHKRERRRELYKLKCLSCSAFYGLLVNNYDRTPHFCRVKNSLTYLIILHKQSNKVVTQESTANPHFAECTSHLMSPKGQFAPCFAKRVNLHPITPCTPSSLLMASGQATQVIFRFRTKESSSFGQHLGG